jgi:hypothetical protein
MPPPTPPNVAAVSGDSAPGSGPMGQVPSRLPRSSSGSPIVHISQSTTATTSGPVGEIMTLERW